MVRIRKFWNRVYGANMFCFFAHFFEFINGLNDFSLVQIFIYWLFLLRLVSTNIGEDASFHPVHVEWECWRRKQFGWRWVWRRKLVLKCVRSRKVIDNIVIFWWVQYLSNVIHFHNEIFFWFWIFNFLWPKNVVDSFFKSNLDKHGKTIR